MGTDVLSTLPLLTPHKDSLINYHDIGLFRINTFYSPSILLPFSLYQYSKHDICLKKKLNKHTFMLTLSVFVFKYLINVQASGCSVQ